MHSYFETRLLQDNIAHTGKYIWKKEHLIDLTFPEVLDRVADQFPEQNAFDYSMLDYTRTYPQFRDDVDTFARSLIAMGVGKGDHVAIWATNVPQWYITFWATTQHWRRAGDGEHRLQDARSRIPAAPVRYAHAGDDRRL